MPLSSASVSAQRCSAHRYAQVGAGPSVLCAPSRVLALDVQSSSRRPRIVAQLARGCRRGLSVARSLGIIAVRHVTTDRPREHTF